MRTKLIKNLTPDEYRQCYNLNFRADGDMRALLVDARIDGQGRVFLEEKDGKLIAWALLCDDYYGTPTFQVYVRKKYRRQGIGTKLLKAAQKHSLDFTICPWDHASTYFYARFDLEPNKEYVWNETEFFKAKSDLVMTKVA